MRKRNFWKLLSLMAFAFTITVMATSCGDDPEDDPAGDKDKTEEGKDKDENKEENKPVVEQQEHEGHECVDLGLSVLWSTCNMGATSPNEVGDLYAWGETTTKSSYNKANYTYDYLSLGLGSLPLEDDAAHVLWGGKWRMPTVGEWVELYDNTTREWVYSNGQADVTDGYKIISKINGKSIFLPATGVLYDNKYSPNGFYWSSSKETYDYVYIYGFHGHDNGHYADPNGISQPYNGNPIRPVFSRK